MPVKPTRGTQQIQQVIGGSLGGQRASGQRPHRPPQRRMRERDPVAAGQGDPVAPEYAGHHRCGAGQRATYDDDLLGRDARPQERQHLARHQLGLGQLAAGLEQADGVAGIDALSPGLEQKRSRWCRAARAPGA